MDGRILKFVNERYPIAETNGGVSSIDGIVISVKDLEGVSKGMTQMRLSEFTKKGGRKINERIRIIDPSLHYLFQGTEDDKKAMLDTGIFQTKFKEALDDIGTATKPSEKIERSITKLYPLLDARLVRNLLEYQIKNDADIIVSPSVPITTTSELRLNQQISKIDEMNRIGRGLFDTVFSGIKERKELMNLLTINVSAIAPASLDRLVDVALAYQPDHVGIRPVNFNEADIPRIEVFLQLIRQMVRITTGSIPVHIFNVTEFGFVAYCHGADIIVVPIATDPYFRRKIEEVAPPRKGAYYHPIDLTHYPYDVILDKTRHMNYRLPCHCEICKQYETITNVPNGYWNEFRRIHFLLVKNMEAKECEDAGDSLKIALRDKFSRSQRTAWLPFLD